MSAKKIAVPCAFDILLSRNVPHVLEMIFLSLDYESYKACLEVSKAWKKLLRSESLLEKARSVFHSAILNDEERLFDASGQGNTEEVRRLLSSTLVDVNCLTTNRDYGCIHGLTPLLEAVIDGQRG